MLGLIPYLPTGTRLRVLCLGAHCDDIEIGCAGTLLALQDMGLVEAIDWVVLTGNEIRRRETERAMSLLVGPEVTGDLVFGEFVDGALPGQYREVKAFFESLKTRFQPHLVLTQERDDRHQDHRLVNEMTWSTFRDPLVLEYEIPKWDGGLGQPNLYVPLSRAQGERKIAVLLESYASQSGRDWFRRETFEAMLRLRGLECRAASGWSEAFHARKLLLHAS